MIKLIYILVVINISTFFYSDSLSKDLYRLKKTQNASYLESTVKNSILLSESLTRGRLLVEFSDFLGSKDCEILVENWKHLDILITQKTNELSSTYPTFAMTEGIDEEAMQVEYQNWEREASKWKDWFYTSLQDKFPNEVNKFNEYTKKSPAR